MDKQILSISTNSLPQVVVTEPSPISIQNKSVESHVRKIETIAEVSGNGSLPESKLSLEQAASSPGPSSNISSGEFVTAEACNECIVPVTEEPAAQQLESASTATLEPEQDNFRSVDVRCCASCGISILEYYEKAWNMIHSGYALPFWLILLASPISAGYMGVMYMYSCPASHSLPMLNFTIGVSLLAVISFRISLILRRMTTAAEGDEWGNMLHTLILISSFLTIVFFITESVAFWRMESTNEPGAKYCDSNFVTYSYWWNCVMYVAMLPIFLFPA